MRQPKQQNQQHPAPEVANALPPKTPTRTPTKTPNRHARRAAAAQAVAAQRAAGWRAVAAAYSAQLAAPVGKERPMTVGEWERRQMDAPWRKQLSARGDYATLVRLYRADGAWTGFYRIIHSAPPITRRGRLLPGPTKAQHHHHLAELLPLLNLTHDTLGVVVC